MLVALTLALDTSPNAVAAKVTELQDWFNTRVSVLNIGATYDVDSAREGSEPRPESRMERLMLLLRLVTTWNRGRGSEGSKVDDAPRDWAGVSKHVAPNGSIDAV